MDRRTLCTVVAILLLSIFSCARDGANNAIAADGPSFNEAFRFLEQATFGPTPELLMHVQEVGFEAFLDEQFSMPITDYPALEEIWPPQPPPDCTGTCIRDNYTMYPLQKIFYQNALTAPDQLRQRVFFALDQILVTSAQNPNLRLPSRMTYYLRTLMEGAFGNFSDLLYNVTLNPSMGRYLDMVDSRRANPNENYAREILQLFSVGLSELNPDGTLKLDQAGNPIPTYDQDTIVAFARAFTGWVFAPPPNTGVVNYRDPLAPNQTLHDTNPKVLLYGVTLPEGQTAEDDLNQALDNIFNHSNVGPFIGKRLIQHLVTSNPSPDYVARVSAAFNDNGAGVRGDLPAVVAAILLDPEARNEAPYENFGKLREPVLAVTSLLRNFGTTEATTDFVLGESYMPASLRMDEDVFLSPTVFNFYSSEYVVPGETVIGPEFGIQSTSTSLARINLFYNLVYHLLPISADRPTGTWIDLPLLEEVAGDPPVLVDALNYHMLHETMTDAMREIIIDAVSGISPADLLGRARLAVYLVATSSLYQVQR
ncbi:MAG: DUF1800 domain-containing protein [Acidobacteria bacterium]|nr:DUF1800 domain-containing protein [Acidobacteriota bacterium]MBI3656068.1 DUF1800 domain-containing protein [Acidobacteriota bacterium]